MSTGITRDVTINVRVRPVGQIPRLPGAGQGPTAGGLPGDVFPVTGGPVTFGGRGSPFASSVRTRALNAGSQALAQNVNKLTNSLNNANRGARSLLETMGNLTIQAAELGTQSILINRLGIFARGTGAGGLAAIGTAVAGAGLLSVGALAGGLASSRTHGPGVISDLINPASGSSRNLISAGLLGTLRNEQLFRQGGTIRGRQRISGPTAFGAIQQGVFRSPAFRSFRFGVNALSNRFLDRDILPDPLDIENLRESAAFSGAPLQLAERQRGLALARAFGTTRELRLQQRILRGGAESRRLFSRAGVEGGVEGLRNQLSILDQADVRIGREGRLLGNTGAEIAAARLPGREQAAQIERQLGEERVRQAQLELEIGRQKLAVENRILEVARSREIAAVGVVSSLTPVGRAAAQRALERLQQSGGVPANVREFLGIQRAIAGIPLNEATQALFDEFRQRGQELFFSGLSPFTQGDTRKSAQAARDRNAANDRLEAEVQRRERESIERQNRRNDSTDRARTQAEAASIQRDIETAELAEQTVATGQD